MSDRDRSARRTRAILVLASLAIAVGMLAIVVTLLHASEQRSDTTLRICRSQVAQNAVLRRVLIEARRQSLTRARNEADIDRIDAAYAPLLRLVPPLECDSQGNPTTTKGRP